MRRAIEVLLPVSILSLVLSYLYSCLPYYLHSLKSLLHTLNLFTTRKSMFLFSNAIVLFLTIKGSSATTAPTSLDNHFTGEALVDDQDSIETEEDDHVVVEKRVIEESVVVVRSSHSADFSIKGSEIVPKEETIGESVASSLELVVGNSEVVEETMEVLAVENELDVLDIEELNKRFDEFIERERRKRRLEALQLIMV